MEMEQLTDEMLEQVFSVLQIEDLRNARLVSQRWRRVSYAFSVQKHVVTVISEYRNMIAMYSPSTEFTDQFKPVNMEVTVDHRIGREEQKIFWEHRSGRLRELTVNVTAARIKVLLHILELCPNLVKFVVNIDGFFQRETPSLPFQSIHFRKLLNLSVSGNYYVVLPLIKRAIENASLLEIIKFTCTGWSCLWDSFHPQLSTSIEFKKALNLKSFHINCSHVDDEFMNKLTLCLGNKLESISIFDCMQFSDLTLKYLQERCTCLKQLIIGQWDNRAFDSADLFLGFVKLTVLSFYSSNLITDEELPSVGALSNLTHLEIAYCRNVTDEGICKIFNNNVKSTIIELRFIKLHITDKVMTEITPLVPNLKILHLAFCKKLTPASLQAVANNNNFLRCLVITDYEGNDLETLRSYRNEIPLCVNRMINLSHLTFFNSTDVTVQNVLSKIALPHLKVLHCDENLDLYADFMRPNTFVKFVNTFSCGTWTFTYNNTFFFLWKKKVTECYESPFGTCKRKARDNISQLSLPYHLPAPF